MKKTNLFLLLIVTIVCLTSCTKIWVKSHLKQYEAEFSTNFPNDYEVLFSKSITNIDSVVTYTVIKIDDDEYELSYDNQLTSDYATYEDFDVFDKIELASFYFTNVIKEEKVYFIDEPTSFDWYGYEYTSTNRYNDLYVVHDLEENQMYIFYDKHQYPYNNQQAR